MTAFRSTEEIYEVLLPFYRSLIADPVVGPKLAQTKTSFRIRHFEPEAVFLLDATKDTLLLSSGAEADGSAAEVELEMSGTDGNRFWLGKLNLPIALARKKIKVAGGVTKLLGLVPALQPAYVLYAAHLEQLGRPVEA
ncbi:hypothetical protein [Parafrankia sp. FMc2]|uniref:hypothetical protein n=1 Tax=Parafrankia sp. FMc2 TaxID=3233196 RepID=UPI0034D77BED